mgnify:CR=1 FL=1
MKEKMRTCEIVEGSLIISPLNTKEESIELFNKWLVEKNYKNLLNDFKQTENYEKLLKEIDLYLKYRTPTTSFNDKLLEEIINYIKK